MNKAIVHPPHLSPEALAHLGDGEIAYIKTIRSEDVPAIFPQAPEIAPGLTLFALHAADGIRRIHAAVAGETGIRAVQLRAKIAGWRQILARVDSLRDDGRYVAEL